MTSPIVSVFGGKHHASQNELGIAGYRKEMLRRIRNSIMCGTLRALTTPGPRGAQVGHCYRGCPQTKQHLASQAEHQYA